MSNLFSIKKFICFDDTSIFVNYLSNIILSGFLIMVVSFHWNRVTLEIDEFTWEEI